MFEAASIRAALIRAALIRAAPISEYLVVHPWLLPWCVQMLTCSYM